MKKLLYILIVISLFITNTSNLYSQSCGSSYPPQIDLDTAILEAYVAPTNSLPGYLVPFTNQFGFKTTRIGDATTFGVSDKRIRHHYSVDQPWNSDGSLIKLSGYPAAILDGDTYAFIKWAGIPGQAIWSNVNPDIMYGISGTSLVKYNVQTNVTTTVKTFSGYSSIDYGYNKGNTDYNDNYIGLIGQSGIDQILIVYDIVNDVILGTDNVGAAGTFWFSISPSGNYAVVSYGADGNGIDEGTKVYDIDLTNERHVKDYTSHSDLGVDVNGDDVYVTFANNYDGSHSSDYYVQMTRLSDGVTTNIGYYPSTTILWGGHLSCRNTDRPGWAYISETNGSARTRDELVAIKLDPNNNIIERYGRHHASAASYTFQPQAVPNRDGTRIMFASEWDGDFNSGNGYATHPPAWVVEVDGGLSVSAPTSLSASPTTGCDSYSTTLSGNCASGVIKWYTSASDTGVGISATQTITANTTFYAKCYDVAEPVTCRYSSSTSIGLTVKNSTTAAITNSICQGDSLLFGGIYRKTAGTYTENVTGSNGCDSVTTLTLSIDNNLCGKEVCFNSSPITIDGVKEVLWTNTYFDTISKLIAGTSSGNLDLFATFNLSWDNTNLYLIAEITDDIKTNDSPNEWSDDGIEIFIDGNNEKNVVYDANDRQFILRWNDNTIYEHGYNTGTNPSGVTFAQTNTPTGYIIEGAVSWSSIGITPTNGKMVGFEIQVNDDDDGSTSLEARKSWYALSSPSSNASLMGVIELTTNGCNNTTKINEQKLSNIKIYPNPTTDYFNIEGITEKDNIIIYDNQGRMVYFVKNNTNTIFINKLNKGVYNIVISNSNEIRNFKLIKQ